MGQHLLTHDPCDPSNNGDPCDPLTHDPPTHSLPCPDSLTYFGAISFTYFLTYMRSKHYQIDNNNNCVVKRILLYD